LQFNIGDYVAALWDQDATGQPDIDVELVIHFSAQPPRSLSLRTPSGSVYPIPSDGSLIRLPATEVIFDERGFITLTLENPHNELVSIDLIALGLVQVP
jgi:hypothetical protein